MMQYENFNSILTVNAIPKDGCKNAEGDSISENDQLHFLHFPLIESGDAD